MREVTRRGRKKLSREGLELFLIVDDNGFTREIDDAFFFKFVQNCRDGLPRGGGEVGDLLVGKGRRYPNGAFLNLAEVLGVANEKTHDPFCDILECEIATPRTSARLRK